MSKGIAHYDRAIKSCSWHCMTSSSHFQTDDPCSQLVEHKGGPQVHPLLTLCVVQLVFITRLAPGTAERCHHTPTWEGWKKFLPSAVHHSDFWGLLLSEQSSRGETNSISLPVKETKLCLNPAELHLSYIFVHNVSEIQARLLALAASESQEVSKARLGGTWSSLG